MAQELFYPKTYGTPKGAVAELLNYYERVLDQLNAYKTGKEDKEGDEDAEYDYFVTDNDAWYREKEAPYEAITPEPRANILGQGLQVAVLEALKDDKNKDVEKIKLKNTQDIEYTSLSNLSQVKNFPKERKYKLLKEYTALKMPFTTSEASETYMKEAEIVVDKYLGDYLKVKANQDFIKHAFSNGFCELPLELIKAFEQEPCYAVVRPFTHHRRVPRHE